MGNKLNLDKKVRAFHNLRLSMMRAVANNSMNFFKVKNFDAQGFIGAPGHVDRWAPRKSPRDNEGRKILVKTGAGRQSIRVVYVTVQRAIIRAEVPYMNYHNEGTPDMPKRQFMGNSEALNAENMRIITRYMKRIL